MVRYTPGHGSALKEPSTTETGMRTYSVVIHDAEEGGFWAEVPALGACYAQGDTVEETLEEVRGAIESHIYALLEDGQTVPRDECLRVETVTVEVPTAA